MYSPRTAVMVEDEYDEYMLRSPERNTSYASPLRAIASPFYEAVKAAQTNVSRDFDRFYGNLQAKLTPRTSESRIRKRTPETTERMRTMLNNRRMDIDSNIHRTSLTPLIERHSIREDARAKYDYPSRNPFYQASESDTPSLIDEDTPMPNYNTRNPSFVSKSNYSSLNEKLKDERQRMDRLQRSLSKIRKQSSFLADEISSTCSIFDDENVEGTSKKETAAQSLSLRSHRPSHGRASASSSNLRTRASDINLEFSITSPQINTSTNHQQLATPPQSIEYNNMNKPKPSTPYSNNTNSMRTSSPIRTSPKRNIINDIGSAKLRSTETISTPGGSRVSNRFWKEIHGLNARRESCSPSVTGRISKRTLQLRQSALFQQQQKSQSWANDEEFWSVENQDAPLASSFNSKLFQAAQQESKELKPAPKYNKKSIFDDEEEDNEEEEDAIQQQGNSLFQHRLFNKAVQQHNATLSDELESAQKRDDAIRKRNNIPTMNTDVLAELKAKHREKLIDDADSYKFS